MLASWARPRSSERIAQPALMGLMLIQIVLLGIAAAVSPLPVILAIALLDTQRPVANSVAYLVGGIVVYLLVAFIGAAVIAQIEGSLIRRHQLSRPTLILVIVIGMLFLLLAVVTWLSKRQVTIPKRVDRMLDSVGPRGAFGLGLLLCRPSLKNVTLTIAALGIISAQGLGFLRASLAMGLFLAIALAPPAAPLATYLLLPPERAESITRGWRAWIEQHGRAVIVVVFATIGTALVLVGLSRLVS